MSNVAEPTWNHAELAPGAIALRSGRERWTYVDLREAAARVGGALAAAGVSAGHRVVLVGPSVPEFVAAYLGGQAAGAVLVTPNAMSTVPELRYVIADSGASLVIAWHGSAIAAKAAAAERGLPFWRLLPGLEDLPDAKALASPLRRDRDDTAVILYTSGTTGTPKGAEITEGNLRSTAEVFEEVLRMTPEDRLGTALPLFHIFGQAVVLGSALHAGASLSLQTPFDPAAMIEMVRRDRVTVLVAVPTMYNALLAVSGEAGPEDFAGLRLAASGGASLPAQVMRTFNERFGCVILEGYGLTESTGAATFNGIDRERKVGKTGVALPRMDVRVLDDHDEEVADGEVGEIVISGPMVMKGYWGRPAETAESLRGGALHTGDLGRRDADGDIEIVDRLKDLIVRGGYNVYPREVEEVLYQHPLIAEAAVVGVPNDHYGEEVGAALALTPDSTLDPETLRAWAKERLSAYKVPRLFAFVDSLPKGPTGKILKREIDTARLTPASRSIMPR